MTKLSKREQEQLARHEHDCWLRERLIEGFEFANRTNEPLRQHRDIMRYEDLGPDEQQLDFAVGEVLPNALAKHRLHLARITKRRCKS